MLGYETLSLCRNGLVPSGALLCHYSQGARGATGSRVRRGMGRAGQRTRVSGGGEGLLPAGQAPRDSETWRNPQPGTSSQHPSLNCSLGSHSPQIRVLPGIAGPPPGMTWSCCFGPGWAVPWQGLVGL